MIFVYGLIVTVVLLVVVLVGNKEGEEGEAFRYGMYLEYLRLNGLSDSTFERDRYERKVFSGETGI